MQKCDKNNVIYICFCSFTLILLFLFTILFYHTECYIHPSQGRCRDEEKRTFFTYSTKTSTCVEIYGCYGIRDRNVFLTAVGCRQACTGSTLGPVTLPNIDLSVGTEVPVIGGDYTISPGNHVTYQNTKHALLFSLLILIHMSHIFCYKRTRKIYLPLPLNTLSPK